MHSTPTDRAAAAYVFDHERGRGLWGAGLGCVFDHKRGNVRGEADSALRRVPPNPQPGVPRPQNRLCPIGDLKLGEDRGQVVGYSLR